jgi:hypothetical protein
MIALRVGLAVVLLGFALPVAAQAPGLDEDPTPRERIEGLRRELQAIGYQFEYMAYAHPPSAEAEDSTSPDPAIRLFHGYWVARDPELSASSVLHIHDLPFSGLAAQVSLLHGHGRGRGSIGSSNRWAFTAMMEVMSRLPLSDAVRTDILTFALTETQTDCRAFIDAASGWGATIVDFEDAGYRVRFGTSEGIGSWCERR